MTSEEKGYESGEGTSYELRVLKDLRDTVKSIDGKVEDILDELKDHPPHMSRQNNEWREEDLYWGDGYDM